MKVITVYSLKGGSGKTTISILLTQLLKAKGYSVTLLDSDEQQQSSADWAKHCELDLNCYVISDKITRGDLKTFIDDDYIIIDGTPRTNDYIEQILTLSDLVVIPIPPTQLALSSFLQQNHLALLKKIKSQGKKMVAVINGVTPHNNNDVSDITKILKQSHIIDDVLTLGQRKAFVIDYDKPFTSSKNHIAKNEMGYLLDTLIEEI